MTTTFENPLALLRQLKGAPLSVYMACLIVRQVVGRDWLCQQTGYTEHAVTTALGYLTSHNFLARVTGGWMVATAAQLPLMAALPEGESDNLIENDFHKKRDKRLFGSADDVVNDESEESQENKSTSTSTTGQKRDKRLFGGKIVSVKTILKEQDEIDACLAVLRDAGIFGNRAADIAEANHVTVDYIKAHLAQVANESWDNPLGMAIWRMGQGIPTPELQGTGHIVGCRCDECNTAKATSRYTSGKYGQFLTGQVDDESEQL